MEEWKEYKLGEVVRLINGRAYSQHELFDTGKYRIVRVGNLSGGDRWFYSNMELLEEKYCEKGDLLYAWACNFGPYIWKGDKTIYHYHIWKLVEDKAVVDRLFLFHYLKYLTPNWLGNVNGSVMVHITKGTMEKFLISLPSITTQRRIASILKSLDDKIEVNKRINENLEQQAQALFKSWFVDFEPFKDGESVESELGMIPKGWKVGQIYEYIDVIYGAPYKSSLFNEEKNGLPLIRIRDLKTFSPQFFTPEILPTTEYIEAGDVVAGMDAEFIPCIWIGEKGVLNQRCCKFKPKRQGVCNYYILFLLKPELEFVQGYKTGTTVSHLGKSDIDRFKVVIPPIEIVSSFSSKADALLKQKVVIANESRRLAELRDALLPRLMSGKLRVEDVKI